MLMVELLVELLPGSGLKVTLGIGDGCLVLAGETEDCDLVVDKLSCDGNVAVNFALRCSFGEALRVAAL